MFFLPFSFIVFLLSQLGSYFERLSVGNNRNSLFAEGENGKGELLKYLRIYSGVYEDGEGNSCLRVCYNQRFCTRPSCAKSLSNLQSRIFSYSCYSFALFILTMCQKFLSTMPFRFLSSNWVSCCERLQQQTGMMQPCSAFFFELCRCSVFQVRCTRLSNLDASTLLSTSPLPQSLLSLTIVLTKKPPLLEVSLASTPSPQQASISAER